MFTRGLYRSNLLPALLAIGVGVVASNRALAESTEASAAAAAVFKQHCQMCHGETQKAPGLDVLDHYSLVKPIAGSSDPYVVAGKSSDSLLWERIEDGSMPPENRPALSDAERQAIRLWIDEGAAEFPSSEVSQRTFIDPLYTHKHVLKHLTDMPESSRVFQRYFLLTNLHNDPTVTDGKLNIFRAAMAKAVNSLTFSPELIQLQPIDEQKTIYAVDLRDIEWENRVQWRAIISKYPYAVKSTDREVEETSRFIEALPGIGGRNLERISVRADWFIATATRPGMYEEILELPDTLGELEEKLGVNRESDWLQNQVLRGGILKSGVSRQNRLLDRYRGNFGAYWISYDFKTNAGPGDLVQRPLGPAFEDNPFPESVIFEHDGGEVIFRLPNGLSGYYLCDAEGNELADGPIGIVSDPNEASGTPAIVNGLSCMGCHKNGIIRFTDVLRTDHNLGGDARRKLEDIIPTADRMERIFERDEEAFLSALLRVVGEPLDVKTTADLRRYPVEPIRVAALHYQRDVNLQTAAAELGYQNVDQLKAEAGIAGLRELLGPLARDGVLKRTNWESREFTSGSLMQRAAEKAGRGIPFQPQ